MAEKPKEAKKVTLTNTKQEMLDAYNELLKKLQEKDALELKPDVEMEKKKMKEIVEAADSLSSEGVVKNIGILRLEMGKLLTQISDRLEEEVNNYRQVKGAIDIKNKEVEEIYGIDKSAQSLAALIGAQAEKRVEFEQEMADKKAKIEAEIHIQRLEWDKEKMVFEAKIDERDIEDEKARRRKEEEYEYAFKREQQLASDKFNDEKAKMAKEMQLKLEIAEKHLAEREKKIAEEEKMFLELQKRIDNFPKEIEVIVQKAVKETAEKIQTEARNREELMKRIFEGEKNVFLAQIDSLEKLTKDQKEQIVRLSGQLEKAYQKVEDIAVKSVGGFTEAKSLLNLQRTEDQSKRQPQEK